MYCFSLFFFFYAAVTIVSLKYSEKNSPWRRKQALNLAFNLINFINAVVSTVLSSVALTVESLYNIHRGKTGELERCTIDSVCGYIVIELVLLVVSSFRLSKCDWSAIKTSYMTMEILHIVGLIGLSSVLLLNTGYPLAIWVIWTELTTVFLSVEDYFENSKLSLKHPTVYWLLTVCTVIVFLLQRVVLFLYLVWLSLTQFVWKFYFIFQLLLLIAGTVLNAMLAADIG